MGWHLLVDPEYKRLIAELIPLKAILIAKVIIMMCSIFFEAEGFVETFVALFYPE